MYTLQRFNINVVSFYFTNKNYSVLGKNVIFIKIEFFLAHKLIYPSYFLLMYKSVSTLLLLGHNSSTVTV